MAPPHMSTHQELACDSPCQEARGKSIQHTTQPAPKPTTLYLVQQHTENCSWNPLRVFPGLVLERELMEILRLVTVMAVSPHVMYSSRASWMNTYWAWERVGVGIQGVKRYDILPVFGPSAHVSFSCPPQP